MTQIAWLGAVIVGVWSSWAQAQTAEPSPTTNAAKPAEHREGASKKRKKKSSRGSRYRPRLGTSSEAANEAPASEVGAVTTDFRLGGSHFIVGAERLTSVLFWKETLKLEARSAFEEVSGEVKLSGTDLGLLGSGFDENVFSVPRLGFDYVFPFGLSLGGAAGYLRRSGEVETTTTGQPGTETEDRATMSAWLVSPRVGFLYAPARAVGVWLRGGVSYSAVELEGETLASELNGWALTLEPQLVLSPASHVAFTLGVPLDIALTGSFERTTDDVQATGDGSLSSYGVSAGLLAIF